MPEKKWKFYIGIGFLILSFIVDIAFIIVPFLGFSGTKIISLMTILAILAEAFFFISILLMGKEIINNIKEKISYWFKKPEAMAPVFISRKRHSFGVWIFFISMLPYPLIEISLLLGFPSSGEHMFCFFLLLAGDILFVTSFFMLGEPFWDKVKKLFSYSESS